MTALRINSLPSLDGIKDVLFLAEHKILPDIIILPKVESDRDIVILDRILLDYDHQAQIFAVIETAQGIKSIDRIISANASLTGLIIGTADISARISCSIKEDIINHVKCEISIAAASYDLIAIDAPCFDLGNNSKLKEELILAKELGYSGKIAIHPDQVNIINKAFTPTKDELEQANRIITSVCKKDQVISKLNGQMLGPPFLKKAQEIVKKYRLANHIDLKIGENNA